MNALSVARQTATIALAHFGVLIGVYFLLLLGDALVSNSPLAKAQSAPPAARAT